MPGNDERRPWQGAATSSCVTDNGKPTPNAPSSPGRRAVLVRGVLEVDLSRHVSRDGLVCVDARAAVHRALSTCPDGVAVRVKIGRAQWVAPGVIDLVAELTCGAGQVEVVGSDDRGVAHAVGGLRDRLEQVVA